MHPEIFALHFLPRGASGSQPSNKVDDREIRERIAVLYLPLGDIAISAGNGECQASSAMEARESDYGARDAASDVDIKRLNFMPVVDVKTIHLAEGVVMIKSQNKGGIDDEEWKLEMNIAATLSLPPASVSKSVNAAEAPSASVALTIQMSEITVTITPAAIQRYATGSWRRERMGTFISFEPGVNDNQVNRYSQSVFRIPGDPGYAAKPEGDTSFAWGIFGHCDPVPLA
ncbi:hypothetical protein C8R44DRAFT_728880 [Mycena epipterygia]|nr:hypothetical protein C8R44DRAFT_728880 [Mycena epipterygia]